MPVIRAPSRLVRPSRRDVLKAGALGVAGAAWPPGLARAAPAVSGSDLKFIFVFAGGGWDPTKVFYAGFDNEVVGMEDGAEPTTYGDLTVVSHPNRSSVDAFFSAWWDRTVVLSGMQVAAIDHFTCARLVSTDTPSADAPDWGAVLAAAQEERYAIPQLALGGPSFPGELAASTVSAGLNGQLSRLIDAGMGDIGNIWTYQPDAEARALIDGWRQQRLEALADDGGTPLRDAYASAMERQAILEGSVDDLLLRAATDLDGTAAVAVDALSTGLSRVVSLAYPSAYETGNWDTHADNDADQTTLFNKLFRGLDGLMASLASTPGQVGETLADETVVVVFSEMGRTATNDLQGGRGHWTYTSAMLVGPGLTGGRTVGGYDGLYQGQLLDMSTGDVSGSGLRLSSGVFGATLLALGGLDPGERLPGEAVLEGVFA